jgi:hypothetical protein
MRELLKQWYSIEREKLAVMSRRKRVQYIWTYYHLWIIGIVSLIVFIIWLIIHTLTGVRGYWFYAVFSNTRAQVGTGSEMWKDFVDYSGYDIKEKNVEFIASSYFDYTKEAAYGNVYYEAFVALSDVGTLDVITMEADSIAALGQSGRLIDLQSEPCADIAKKYEDRLIYYYPPDDAEDDSPVAVGIDVSDSRLVTEYGLYQDSCGIAVGAHSQNIAAVEAFLDFILEDD